MSSSRIPDAGSLIAGVAFAGIGLIFLVGDVELADRVRWVWPIVLVGLGAGLLAAVLRQPGAADGPAAGTADGETATFAPAEPSTPAPEPAAAAAILDEPPGEPVPDTFQEGSGPATGPAEGGPATPGPAQGSAAGPDLADASAVEPDLADDGAAEPDAVEEPAAGDPPDGAGRS